jgi:tetratricopeptide (TPR) repeat protein
MEFLELEEAIHDIKRACDENSKPEKFFFIIGAGISFPPVPLSTAIVEHCKEQAEKAGYQASTVSLEAPQKISKEYSFWMRKAYPQPKDRQNYLRELIEGKPISHANLRLAHLLLEPKIANLVVTTNFDDFLSRALTLFGKPHLVCDHPRTSGRIDPEREDVQIIHVHGSYWFYDCCNLTGEIAHRSELSPEQSQSMASLLDRILANRSPIVVGYGGWEEDVIMQALHRRLESGLNSNLYWFLRERPNPEKKPLPDWLRNHPHVIFVVPKEILPESSSNNESQTVSGRGNTPKSLEKGDGLKGSTLDAQKVFGAMIQHLGIEPPLLTQDPLQHFREHLETSLPQDAGGQQDPYSFQAVIAQIGRAKEQEQEQQPDVLEPIRNAFRKAQYRETIQLVQKILLNGLENDLQRQELIRVLWSAASSLCDDSAEELLAYRLIVNVYDALPLASQKPALTQIVSDALFYEGLTLDNLNRLEEAIAVYDILVERFGTIAEPILQEQVAKALCNKGITLSDLNLLEDAITAYDTLIERFSKSIEPTLQAQVASALFNKGITLGNLNRSKEEIAAYDTLIERFSKSIEPTLQARVASALFNKGAVLGNLNRLEDAIAAYDILLERFGKSTEPTVRELVADALLSKGIALDDLNRSKDAIAVYDILTEHFGKSTEPALQELVANALFREGIALDNLNRPEDAIAVYDILVERFGKSTEPALQTEVAYALGNRGFMLLCQAKKIWVCDVARAKALLSTAQKDIRSALERLPKDACSLGNMGYIEFLTGNPDKAVQLLTKALQIGGEKIRQDALEDSQIYPVQQDEAFRELMQSLKVNE